MRKLTIFVGLFICLGLLASCFTSKQSGDFSKNKFVGKYSYGTNVNEGPVGSIHLYPNSDSTSYFYLELNQGAPSLRSDVLTGFIKVLNTNRAIYSTQGEGGGCIFELNLKDDKIQITTDPQRSDCFFFVSFSANGIYKCKSSARPEYYIDRHADTIYFENIVKMLNKKK